MTKPARPISPMRFSTRIPSPVGTLFALSDGTSLAGLWIEGQKHFPPDLPPEAGNGEEELPVFSALREWLTRYFSGERPPADALPLAPEGTAFQRRIWLLLREIPYGEVVSYGELADKAASFGSTGRMSARAVGGAVGRNPISIVVPCHRVVGADGSLTGYAGGIEVKRRLLELEGVRISGLVVRRPR